MPSPLRTGTCAICGNTFQTRVKKTETCGRKCGAILREQRTPSPGSPPREYPEEIIQRVRDMYEAGATVLEIGRALGPGYKAQRLVERYVTERRPAIPRDQSGERNPLWKGDDAGFKALHLRVAAIRGKPQRCACCDTSDPAIRYEWANLTGHYEDIYDYARLCVPCHRRLDARRRAVLGHHTMTRRPKEVMVNV